MVLSAAVAVANATNEATLYLSVSTALGLVGLFLRSWLKERERDRARERKAQEARDAEDQRTRRLVSDLLRERNDELTERLANETSARNADRAACEERELRLSGRIRTLELHHARCGLTSIPPGFPAADVTPTDDQWAAAKEAEAETWKELRGPS